MPPEPPSSPLAPDRHTAPASSAIYAGLSQPLLSRFALLGGLDKIVDTAGLSLLMLASCVLLFRPGDLFPSLAGLPIYNILIVSCLVVSLPRLVPLLAHGSLRRNAILALVLLLVPAVVLSHLSHANTYEARLGGTEMLKACTFFVLLVVLVNSARKLTITLLVVMAAVFAVTALAVLQHHQLIYLPTLQGVAHSSRDGANLVPLMRLRGVGLFNDPNDFALVLVTAAVICVFALGEWRNSGWGRATRYRGWLLLPLALFGYALLLTHSRGGLLSAVAALLIFLPARFGWRNALPMACLILPLFLVPFWGRATSVSLDDPNDTFQTRIGLWSDSLEAFRSAPILGIGQGRLPDVFGQVTHNSYLQAFAEMGLLGGAAFVGAFYLVLRGLWRAAPADPTLARLRPYLLAATVGYAIGLLSLSRCYTVPTQLVLALATIYLVLASRTGPSVIPRLDWSCTRRIVSVGVLFLMATYVFVRLTVNRG